MIERLVFPRYLSAWQHGTMSKLATVAQGLGWSSVAIGVLQMIGGSRLEAGMGDVSATVDSHVRFMGPMFMGYGVGWLDAAQRNDTERMELLAALMGAGGCSRLITRATMGRPHRFHDALMAVELFTPVVVELLVRGPRRLRWPGTRAQPVGSQLPGLLRGQVSWTPTPTQVPHRAGLPQIDPTESLERSVEAR